MKRILPLLHEVISNIDLPGYHGEKACPLYGFYDFSCIPSYLSSIVPHGLTVKAQLEILFTEVDKRYKKLLPNGVSFPPLAKHLIDL